MKDIDISAALRDMPSGITVRQHVEEENNVMHFNYHGCVAVVGAGYTTVRDKQKPWATVYRLEQNNRPVEDSKHLLSRLKKMYEANGFDFGYSFADTAVVKGLLYKLGIKVREEGTGEIVH